MTTPNHFVQGYVACDLLGLPAEVCILGAVVMASNDLHGWYDSIKLIIQTKSIGTRDWRHRARYHRLGLWVYFILLAAGILRAFDVEGWFIPLFPLVHMLFDHFLHKREGGINAAYLPTEIATDLILVGYLIWMVMWF